MINDNVLGDLHDYHLDILKVNVDWGRLVLDAIEEIERQQLVITCLQNEVIRLNEIAFKIEAGNAE